MRSRAIRSWSKRVDPPMNVLPSSIDVAIVGAGASGIAAARRLERAGIGSVLLEARNRLAGRAHSVWAEGHALDLGCGWLHSADENPLADLARDEGFTVDETPPPWGQPPAFGLGLSAQEQDEFRTAFADFDDRIAEAGRRGEDRPASDLFEPGSRWNGRMDAISGALNGTRFSQVSSLDYDRYRDTGVNHRVVEGYGRLIERLGLGLATCLQCAVQRIDYSGPRLRIETTRGTVEARLVILTVPTRLIAEEGIRFDPPLPDLVEAAAGTPLGLASKVFLNLAKPHDFPVDGHVWGRTDTAETGGYHLRPLGRPMIEAYFGGDLARGLEADGDAALVDFAIGELVALLGSDLRRRLDPIAVSMWGREPWSGGAYSHSLPGHAGDRQRLARPVENRIFIAGEATAPAFYGTAHGAWMEGERAALEALAALGIDRWMSEPRPEETDG